MSILANVKTRLEIASADTSKDAKLALLIADAEELFLEYTNLEVRPSGTDGIIEQLVVYAYTPSNIKSESLGDHDITYMDTTTMPGTLTSQMNKYRVVKAL